MAADTASEMEDWISILTRAIGLEVEETDKVPGTWVREGGRERGREGGRGRGGGGGGGGGKGGGGGGGGGGGRRSSITLQSAVYL